MSRDYKLGDRVRIVGSSIELHPGDVCILDGFLGHGLWRVVAESGIGRFHAFNLETMRFELIQKEPDIAAFNAEQEYRESIQEDPMPEHPSLPLTPENIERVARAIIAEFDHHTMSLVAAVKSVLEREAKPKPKVFTVTMEGSVTRDGVIAALITSSRYEENRLITVEEVTP